MEKTVQLHCVELSFPTNSSFSSSSTHSYQTSFNSYPFMASKLLMRNRMKPKDHHQKNDVVALEKTAAWAWSGSEGKTMREFHLARTQSDHRPSRYKLEAMRMSSSSSSQETKEEGLLCPVQHTNEKLPLLDAYEVRSILRRLENLIAESDDDKLDERMKKKKKVGKGIRERRRVRAICSTRKEDVVDGTRSDSNKSQIQLSAANKRSMPRLNGGRVM